MGSNGSGDGQFGTQGIAVTANGLVYVADQSNDRIQRFDEDGNFQTRWGSEGTGDGQFEHPGGVAVAPTGLVYVADTYNGRIQRFFDLDAWCGGTYPLSENLIVEAGEIVGDSFTVGARRDLKVAGNVTVAGSGAAALTVTNGGGFASDGRLLVGESAAGTLTVSGGGTVTTGTYSTIGLYSTNESTVTVTGQDSTWHTGSGNFWVGRWGAGSLTIEDQGQVTTGWIAFVGDSPGGEGQVTVSGPGSIWRVGSSCLIGGSTAEAGGAGFLTVEDGGTVEVGTSLKVWKDGRVVLDGGTLDVTGTTAIDPMAELTLDEGTLKSSTLANGGLIRGSGQIDASLENAVNGTALVFTGEHQRFDGAAHSNHGNIFLSGGTVEFTGLVTNETDGLIAGNGSLTVNDGLVNAGTIAFSPAATVSGDLTNAATGVITVGGVSSSFQGDVVNQGEFRAAGDSTAIFHGLLTGDGSFTETGIVEIEGDFRPGNSPGLVEFGGDLVLGSASALEIELGGLGPADYDRVSVDGTLAADGMLDVVLINNFTPEWGDTFDIFEFGTCTGEFGEMSLPGLAGRLVWDTSGLYTNGTLMVTPEPSTLVLLAGAGLALVLIRRRRR